MSGIIPGNRGQRSVRKETQNVQGTGDGILGHNPNGISQSKNSGSAANSAALAKEYRDDAGQWAVGPTDFINDGTKGYTDDNNSKAYSEDSEASASDAEASQGSAAVSATEAAASATDAATSSSTASGFATAAGVSATAAAASETAAAGSATSASDSAAVATTQAASATTSATDAAASATGAEASRQAAVAQAAAANISALAAGVSASNAATSATDAAASETAAGTSATAAAASATAAGVSATAAATSATAADASETLASEWAVGPSKTDETPTDENNAFYWSEQAKLNSDGLNFDEIDEALLVTGFGSTKVTDDTAKTITFGTYNSIAGHNISVVYDDDDDTITITNTGGGVTPPDNQSKLTVTLNPTEIIQQASGTTTVTITSALSSGYTIKANSPLVQVTDTNNDAVTVTKVSDTSSTFVADNTLAGTYDVKVTLTAIRTSDSMEFTDTKTVTLHIRETWRTAVALRTADPLSQAAIDSSTSQGVFKSSESITFTSTGNDTNNAYIYLPTDATNPVFKTGVLFAGITDLGAAVNTFDVYRVDDFDDTQTGTLTIDITEA